MSFKDFAAKELASKQAGPPTAKPDDATADGKDKPGPSAGAAKAPDGVEPAAKP